MQQTSVAGQQAIRQQMHVTKEKLNESVRLVSQLINERGSCFNTWNQVDKTGEELAKWLKTVEVQLQTIELKSTLKQKQDQMDELIVRFPSIYENHIEFPLELKTHSNTLQVLM